MTTLTQAPFRTVDRVDGISLEQLVAQASLLTRVDRKYVLPTAAAGRVLAALAQVVHLQALDIGGQRAFGYESLYFDTPDLLSYHLAARGRRRKFKVRRRTYLDSGDRFIEVKTSSARGFTIKERQADDATSGAFVDSVLGQRGFGIRSHDLRPTLTTAYRRTTLFLSGSQARVTVDTDLSWSVPGGPDQALGELTIIETKSGSKASEADHRLWQAGFRPARISKYATGLAALHPRLPSNRWHPVLSRHFSGLAAA